MTLEEKLTAKLGKSISDSSNEELYAALCAIVKEGIKERPVTSGNKKLYYISAEFLTGRQLGRNLVNLHLYNEALQLFKANGKDLSMIEECEPEPSLGNGGLGRLAACFLDSIASLDLNGDGIGLRYHFGLFKQEFVNHCQSEIPDRWLTKDGWLTKTDVSFPVRFGNLTVQSRMYDLDVIGFEKGHTRLHLFDIDTVDESIVTEGITFDKKAIDKNLTLFLYPDDSDKDGQLLRIYQQYFMVSNAAQLIIREQKELGHSLHHLNDYVAIQINDTHPSLVIPELMRLLIAEGISFKEAAGIVSEVCAYTNHTILAEALEKWPMSYLNEVVPHLMPIIGGLDYAVVCAYHDNRNLNIIDDSGKVHMANMDMHFSHSVNGVAALHTEILKNQELRPFFEIYPQKFNNKTNGITFHRWIMHSNPELTNFIIELIGTDWFNNPRDLERLMYFHNDENTLRQIDEIKKEKKRQAAEYIRKIEGIEVDPDSVFSIHVKRMHEYKRQQMNALYIIYEYLRIKSGIIPAKPVTVIFGGKAAPAYIMAKNVIHLILCLQELVNNDPVVSKHLRVVMLQNYNVAKAEHIIPAADISEQISLASKEASGTGNMKFMLNGAVTLGTNDGANVEIRDLVGWENIYTFGRSSDEVINLYNTNGYHAIDFYNRSEHIRNCIDFITSKELCAIGNREMLEALQHNLKNKDWFMTLLDLEHYCNTKETAIYDYLNRGKWTRMMLVNIARSGFFSSDRTIAEYNRDIWHLK
ncbi:MAG: glycogen/starch/alpha-glucan family phosphorylase [Solobacterium sp.]|nr:glycogen/starch/alpha-glucan family phosphorylase [Solobacterium sp.]